MQLSVSGKHIDVGQALRGYVEEHMDGVATKYFSNPLDATVTFSQEAHLYHADISARVGRGIVIQSVGEASEPYPAFDQALSKLAKRLQRYKSRLRDHHQKEGGADEFANQYVLDHPAPANDSDEHGDPAIIAEMPTHIGIMSVAEAVMYMDLADLPAYMFRNSAHDGLNMVYRRADGNIGWVDPRGNLKS